MTICKSEVKHTISPFMATVSKSGGPLFQIVLVSCRSGVQDGFPWLSFLIFGSGSRRLRCVPRTESCAFWRSRRPAGASTGLQPEIWPLLIRGDALQHMNFNFFLQRNSVCVLKRIRLSLSTFSYHCNGIPSRCTNAGEKEDAD